MEKSIKELVTEFTRFISLYQSCHAAIVDAEDVETYYVATLFNWEGIVAQIWVHSVDVINAVTGLVLAY